MKNIRNTYCAFSTFLSAQNPSIEGSKKAPVFINTPFRDGANVDANGIIMKFLSLNAQYLLTIILLFGISFVLNAQQVQVKVSADTNAILIGEQVKLDLQYQFPENQIGLFPSFKDTITSQLEIVKQSPIDTLINSENGLKTLSQQLTITSFDTGHWVIPPLPFGLMQKGDTSYDILQSNPLLLNVFTVEVDTTKDIKPITLPMGEPYTLSEILPYITIVLAVGILIFAIFYFYQRKKKNKPLFVKKEKPALPPHEEAINNLEELRLKKLWQNDRLKEYHSELTDIIRYYIERRFNFQALEMVSSEILDRLEGEAQVNEQVRSKLQASLELADLVKFAKSGATAIENDTSWNNCVDFVNETKSVPKPEEKPVSEEGKEVKDVQ